jgi:hypothetical protein
LRGRPRASHACECVLIQAAEQSKGARAESKRFYALLNVKGPSPVFTELSSLPAAVLDAAADCAEGDCAPEASGALPADLLDGSPSACGSTVVSPEGGGSGPDEPLMSPYRPHNVVRAFGTHWGLDLPKGCGLRPYRSGKSLLYMTAAGAFMPCLSASS